MMRSLYSAVSGLKTHQTRMDVIGNNISNVNTEAFKSTSVVFSEIMYQTTSNASGGNVARGIGGINAKQIGLGVSMGATTVSVESAGAAETTGNPFDLKLTDSQSTNFYIVSDGTNTMFTRAGSFYVDGNGFLCMSTTGYTLMGWQVDPTTGDIRKDTVSPLQVMSAANQISAPEATTLAYASGVLDKNDSDVNSDDGYVMTLGFYDALGYAYTAKFSLLPSGAGGEEGDTEGEATEGAYTVNLTDILDQNGDSIIRSDAESEDGAVSYLEGREPTTLFPTATITYDRNNGTFVQIDGGGIEGSNPPIYDVTGAATENPNMNAVILRMSSITTGEAEGEEGGVNSNFSNITIDFSLSMNYNNGGTSSMKLLKGDSAEGDGTGKKLGKLTGLSVDNAGQIWGSYDNGNTVLLCQISVAQFANASGLEKVGENCYQTTLNSGEFDGIGVEVTNDGSSITTGELEMSNVDLSSEFTGMIVTQRGFQANSRVITTSDTLLEELINLKR